MGGLRANWSVEAMRMGHNEVFPGKAAGLEKERLCCDHHYTMSEHLLREAYHNGK